MKQLIFGITCIFVAVSASYSDDYEIQVCKLQSHSDKSTAYMSPCEAWISKNQCNDGWIAWDISQFQGQLMYSTALSAMLANKAVTVRLDSGCLSYDQTSMIRINN